MTTKLADSFTHPSKEHVRFFKDVVIKSGPIDRLRIEVAKTQQAYLIGEECGLFRVPQVKDFDDQKGHVVFERILDIQSMRERIAFCPHNEHLASRIGHSLAVIHQRLQLSSRRKIRLKTEMAGPEPHVFLHGDYSLDNICLSSQGSLVILDWQTSKLHGGEATYDTGYYDVAWFLTNLFYLRSRGRDYAGCFPVTGLAIHFIESYLTHTPDAIDGVQMQQYLKQFFDGMAAVRKKYFARRRRFRVLFLLPGYKRFIRNCVALKPNAVPTLVN
jgi:hypothetical protein